MVNNRTRNEIRGSSCSKPYEFVFEWSLENRKLPPSAAFLRVHMQSRDNRFPKDSTVAVDVSATLQATDTIAETDDERTLWTFLKSIDVQKNSSGWLEFNVTQLLFKFWSSETQQAIVSITLRFDVNCTQNEKIPMKLTNPVAWSVDKARRSKASIFQPFLVISTDDIRIKRVIVKNIFMFSSDEPILSTSDEQPEPERRKRDTDDHICRVEDFVVSFSDLGISNILRPLALNVKQCSGSCSINYAHNTLSLTTNHARLMTSAASIHENHTPSSNPSPPKNPCCTPISYHPAYLMIGYPHSTIEVKLYSEFTVKECGCR